MSDLLPDWLEPLPEAVLMREADRHAIEELGIPGIELMERAAAALAAEVSARCPIGEVLVVCGKGNNGGDGLAAARLLRDQGRHVIVMTASDPADWNGDAAQNLLRLGEDSPPVPLGPAPAGVSCVVDCLLGTGASGAPEGDVLVGLQVIRAAAATGATVIACDVPSGVDASTGEVPGEAVEADATVTFHAIKPGLRIAPGKRQAGELVKADIGIPPGGLRQARCGLLTAAVVEELPVRGGADDKFSSGSVLVFGGSPGLTGAPLLCGRGAARAGAGYVTVAFPASLLAASDAVPELMGLALPEMDGSHTEAGALELAERTGASRAAVIGPGLGRSESAAAAALALERERKGPAVLDADGLRAAAAADWTAGDNGQPLVLTPHAGEVADLLGRSREEVEAHRLASVSEAAERFDAVCVLKGDDTLIAAPGGPVAVSPGGAPALATAGSGDVLGGIVAALLAREVAPFRAACAGVLLHLEAGRAAAQDGTEGVLASDIAEAVPAARHRLESGGR